MAVVKVNPTGELTYGISCNLPGPIQTVPRGNIYALLLLLMDVQVLSELTYVTDNEGLFKTSNGGPKAGRLSANCDLYHQTFQITYDKAIRLKVRWMPSHLSVGDARPQGISDLDLEGNKRVDEMAKKTAARQEIPLQPAINYV